MSLRRLTLPFQTALVALCLVFGIPNAGAELSKPLTDRDINKLLKTRIDVEKKSIAIMVGVIDDKGVRVFAYGVEKKPGGRIVNPRSIFEIGSITKIFTSLLLADMVEKGEVKLSDPVAMYLPKAVTMPSRNGRQITLLDLSTHKSGLPRLPDDFGSGRSAKAWATYTNTQMYAFLSSYQLTSDIGESDQYSNLGAGLLGHVLALRTGIDFETLIRTRITEPLGMKDTCFTLNREQTLRFANGHLPNGELAPHLESPTLAAAGALRSTMADMLTFLKAAMGETDSPLRAAFARMERPLEARPELRLAWGYNDQFGSKLIWHQGNTLGFSSHIGIDTARHKGVVVLSNTKNGVLDIGFKTLNSEHDLIQQVPPKTFVRALERQGYDKATELFDLFKKRDKEFEVSADVAHEWGHRLIDEGKNQRGINILKLGVHMRPTKANSHDSLAHGYERTGNLALALSNYERALTLEPEHMHSSERLKALNTELSR